MRNPYPPECPAFRVTARGIYLRLGAIVEGQGPSGRLIWTGSYRWEGRENVGYIAVRAVSFRDVLKAGRVAPATHGIQIHVTGLEPLTAEARRLSRNVAAVERAWERAVKRAWRVPSTRLPRGG